MGDNAVYLESTGHYYESIHSESAITWADAKAAAEARSLSGMQGYLATILSEEESVFLGSKAPDNAWMGANDAAVEGEWRWVAGPENTTGLGTLFYYQGNGTTLPGFYTNWNNNEPNDFEAGEDCGQILGNSDEKKWNDLPNAANVSYYLVEYGGMPDEPTPQLTVTITVNVNSVNDAPSMPGNFTNPLHVQSVERGRTINVTWGESTDLENDSIVYDLWFYNETWTHIANSLSINSYMFTIPFDNVSEVMLKVYANDSVTNSSENNVTFNLTSITPGISFTANVTSGSVPLTVNLTDLSSHYPTVWEWDFGDGNTSTDQSPIHTYYGPGNYNVSLNASNLGGYNISIQTAYITATSVPVASFSSNVTSGAAPLSVSFTDLSTNEPTSWLWNFGDGNTSTEQTPNHTYIAAGTYTVSLNATNAAGSDTTSEANYIHAAVAPVSGFSADVTSGAVPLAVEFTDQSTNIPTSWLWNFGDGQTSTEQNPTHTYVAAGSYTVSLNATNAGGSDTTTEANYIRTAVAPVSSFIVNVTSGAVPLTVEFADQSTNTPTSWLWNFGDGQTSTEQNPVHTYASAGTYTVSMNATNIGGSDTTTQTEYIHAAVAPIANFTVNAVSGSTPFAATFTDLSTNEPTSWLWNFGDGQTSTEQNPVHTYVTAGTYTVSLNTTNAGGSNTATQANYITATRRSSSSGSSSGSSSTYVSKVNVSESIISEESNASTNVGSSENSGDQPVQKIQNNDTSEIYSEKRNAESSSNSSIAITGGLLLVTGSLIFVVFRKK
jgi:PKD repeat protein